MVKSVSKTHQRNHHTIHLKDSWFSVMMQVPCLVRLNCLGPRCHGFEDKTENLYSSEACMRFFMPFLILTLSIYVCVT